MRAVLGLLLFTSLSCTPEEPFPNYTYSSEHVIPSQASLIAPEDGVGLPDGRIVVAHNEDGLHAITKDGTSMPFGNMNNAGYAKGGARGVFLEPDNEHLLVSCVYSGKIFRVNIEGETSTVIYRHPYGINNIYRDKRGIIWFTQSANNENGTSKALDDAFANPLPTGAVYRLRTEGGQTVSDAKLVADSLFFANGITMDEQEEHLFVSEYRMDRILRYQVDPSQDTLISKEQYSLILSPDNLERDPQGNIWVASLMQNKVFGIDKDNRSRHEIFSVHSEINEKIRQEWVRKTNLGKSVMDVYHPDMWKPLTGPLTGVFWSYNREKVYFTGLGTKILEYPYDE